MSLSRPTTFFCVKRTVVIRELAMSRVIQRHDFTSGKVGTISKIYGHKTENMYLFIPASI